MTVSYLLQTLQRGDIPASLKLMREWLLTATPGAPEALLRDCPPALAPRVALLMRDLLSRYPATLLGAPVLLYYVPETETGPSVTLPYPDPEHAQPCADLHFIGWLPPETTLPVPLPYHPNLFERTLKPYTMQAAVALFRTHPGVFELESLDLPHHWWGELFLGISGNIQLEAQLLLPYPDALEAARVLASTANNQPTDKTLFLSDSGWCWAHNAGTLFQETCRHLFPPLSARTSPSPGLS